MIGIIFANFYFVKVFFLFCLFLILIFVILIIRKKEKRILILFLLMFLLGVARYQMSLPQFNDDSKIYHYLEKEQRFYGTILSVEQRISLQKIIIESNLLSQQRSFKNISGKVLINAPLYPVYNAGEELAVNCYLTRPKKFNDFDYGKYLARYDTYALCQRAEIVKISKKENGYKNYFNLWRNFLSGKLAASMKEPQASFFQSFILNDRGNLSQFWLEKFSRVGLSHVVAISGSHIVLLVMIISTLLNWLGLSRIKIFWPTVIIIFSYILVIGAPASAVRAAIMALLLLLAQKVGRVPYSGNMIILAAAVMSLINPKIILDDIGFQLSFVSVLGLIYLEPYIRSKISFLPSVFNLPEMVSVSLAAQIASLPLIAYYFHQFSVIALLANLLVLPLVPLMLIFGLINVIVASLFLPFGILIGWINWFMGGYFLMIVDVFSNINLSVFDLKYLPDYLFLLLYLPLIILVHRLRKNLLK